MNRWHMRIAAAWLVSVGVGCTSAPVRYYTLTPAPAEIPVSQTSLPVEVRVVHTPPQINRAELMVRTGPSEVTLLENERWAAPINDEIRNAVRVELERRLSRMTAAHPDFTELTLDIDVKQFEAELGRYALLEASWSATLSAPDRQSHGAPVATGVFHADEKISAGYAGMVEGYQRDIAALTDAIAAVLTIPAVGIDTPLQESIEASVGAPGARDH